MLNYENGSPFCASPANALTYCSAMRSDTASCPSVHVRINNEQHRQRLGQGQAREMATANGASKQRTLLLDGVRKQLDALGRRVCTLDRSLGVGCAPVSENPQQVRATPRSLCSASWRFIPVAASTTACR